MFIPKKSSGFLLLALMIGAGPNYAQSPEGTWHGEPEGVKFFPSGKNIAYDKPAATVNPKLTEHSQKMVPSEAPDQIVG